MAGRGSLLSGIFRQCRTASPLRRPLRRWQSRLQKPPSTPLLRPPIRLYAEWGPRRLPPQYNRFGRAQRVYGLWNTSPTFRLSLGVALVGGGVFYYSNLETVPISGRRRFNCVSPETEEALSDQQLGMMLKQFEGRILPPNHPAVVQIQQVLDRLLPAAGLDQTKFELRVINDPDNINAMVAPGGKVFVFTGILPVCGGEDGMAAVLGHEIAHSLAHHAAEKMSRMWFIVGAAILLSLTLDISGQLASWATELVLSLPNSRAQESEADHIGLLLMAQACYDPKAAVSFWERMEKAEKYAPPQILSTHPGSGSRVKAIEGWMPEAEDKLTQSDCSYTQSFTPRFRQAYRQAENDFF